MPKSVDDRVVRMQFDNAQFERKVSGTMKLLQEFEDQLQLKGAEKGIEEVQRAADKVNFSGMEKGISKLKIQFDELSAVAIHQINRLVDHVSDAGMKMVKSLTLDNITAGFDKYTEKTASVQTIMNATGKSVEDVNNALAKLQWFSDETSYSFTDMTSNVGKFTSAGVDLNVAVSAMQGIANAAADAGANSTEASRAMYNFSQALSRGYVQLIDWKSIENANMATITFKDTIVQTAAELGTLKRQADGTYTTLQGNAVSATNFNENLKDAWFTNEVLLKSLSKYSAYSDAIYEVSDAFDTCADAMAVTSSEGMELGARAFKAAQQAKTFTEAIDATRDAVSSGWMRTFEIIFGNFNESVELWTEFTNTLWDVFASGADSRNALLKEGLMSGWDKFMENGIKDSVKFKEALIDVYDKTHVGFDKLEITVDNFEETLSEGWLTAWRLGDGIDAIVKEIKTLDAAELENRGYTKDSIESFLALKKQIDDGTISLEEFAEEMKRPSGRENLIQSIRNAFESLNSIVQPVKKAIRELFPATTAENLYKITESIKNFTAQFKLSAEAANTLKVTLKALFLPIKMIATAFKVAISWIGSFIVIAFKLADRFMSLLSTTNLLDIGLRKLFGEKYDRVMEAWNKIVTKLSNAFAKVKQYIVDIMTGVKEGKTIDKISNAFGKLNAFLKPLYDTILEGIVKGLEKIAEFDPEAFITRLELKIKEFLSNFPSLLGAIGSIKSAIQNIKNWFDGKTIIDVFNEIGKLVVKLKDKFVLFVKNIDLSVVWDYITSKGKNIIDFFNKLGSSIGGFLKQLDPAKILIFAFGSAMVLMILQVSKVASAMTTMFSSITAIADKVGQHLRGTVIKYELISASLIGIAAALFLLTTVDSKKLLNAAAALGIATVAVGLMVGAMSILATVMSKSKDASRNLTKLTVTVIAVAASIGALAIALSAIADLPLEDFAIKLASITGAIIAIVAALGLLTGLKTEIDIGIKNAIALGISMMLLATTLKMLTNISFNDILNAIMGVVACAIALKLVASTAASIKFSGGLGLITSALAVLAYAKVLENLAKVNTSRLINGLMNFQLLFIAFAELSIAVSIAGKQSIGAAAYLASIGIATLALQFVIEKLGSLDDTVLKRGMISVGTLIVALSLITRCFKTVSKDEKVVKGAGKTLLSMSVAIGILSGIIALLGLIDPWALAQGTVAVGFLIKMMAVLLKASNEAKKVAGTLAVLSLVIGMSTAAIVLLTLPDWQEVMLATAAFSVTMVSIAKILKNVQSLTLKEALPNILLMAGIFTAIGLTVGILSNKLGNINKAIASSASVSMLLIAVGATMKLMNSSQFKYSSLEKYKTSAVAMLGFLVLIGASISLISAFGKDSGNIISAGAAMAIALLGVAGAIKIMDESKITDAKCAKMEAAANAMIGFILELGIVLGALVGITSATGVDISSIGAASVALGLAVNAVALAIRIMTESNVKEDSVNSLKKTWLPVAGFILELGIALGLLGNFGGDWKNIVASAIGLGLAINAIAVAMNMMDGIKNVDTGALIKMVAAITVMLAALVGAFVLLAKADVSNVIVNAVALSVAINAIAFATNLLRSITIGDALGIVLAIVPVILGLAYALTLMGQIDAAQNIANIAGISLILAELTAMMIVFNLLGKYITITKSAVGTGALDAVILILGALLELIGWLTSNEAIRDNLTRGIEILKMFEDLTPVLIEMTAFMGAMAALGYNAQVAIGAVGATAGFDGIVLLIGGLVYALGSIMQDENAQKIAQDGLQFFKDLGLAIGEFFGNLVGGIATGLTNGLDKAADNLDNFISKLAPALEKMSDAGSTVAVENIKNLASALLTLTGNDLLSRITGSSTTLSDFATELASFADPFKTFLETMSAADIDDKKVETVGKSAEVLAAFANSLPKEGGWLQAVIGETQDLKKFAEGLAEFAPAFKDFLTTIQGVTVSNQDVESFKNAATALSEFGNSLNRHGGWLQKVVGETESLTEFANDLIGKGTSGNQNGISLAEALVEFSNIISEGSFDSDLVKKAASAAAGLANFADKLPDSGGKIEWFVGKKATISEFVHELTSGGLASALVSFSRIITNGDFNEDSVKKAANAASALSDFADNLYTRGDAFDWLTGKQVSLKSFGEEIASFGPNFKIFATSIIGSSIDPAVLENTINAMNAINMFAQNLYTVGDPDMTKIENFGTVFRELSNTYNAFAIKMARVDPGIVSTGIKNLKDFLGFAQVIGNGETDYTNAAAKWSEALSELAGEGLDAFINEFVGFANSDHVRTLRRGINNFLATFKKEFDAKANDDGSLFGFAQIGHSFIAGMVSSIVANVNEASEAGEAVAEAIKTQVEGIDIDLSAVATGIIDKFGTSLTNMRDTLKSYTEDAFGGFSEYLRGALGISEEPSKVSIIISELIDQLSTSLTSNKDEIEAEFSDMALSSIRAFNSSLMSEASLAASVDAISDMCDDVVIAAKEVFGLSGATTPEFYKIGRYIDEGLAEGLEQYSFKPKSSAIKMAESILKTFKTYFQIKSPSRVMRDEVGTYIVEGIAEGIKENTTADDAAKQCAENILNAFKNSFSKADLDDVTGDLEDQLWEKLNPDATAYEKDSHQMASLDAKLKRQAERVNAMDAAYQATVQLFGAESQEAQEAYNEYLQAQIDMADLANQMAEANKNYAETQEQAKMGYIAYYYENEDLVKKGLLTSEELWQMAKEAAGYDANYTGHDQETSIQRIINRYMSGIVNASIPDVEEIKDMLANLPVTAEDVDDSLGATLASAVEDMDVSQMDNALNNALQDSDVQELVNQYLGGDTGVNDAVEEVVDEMTEALDDQFSNSTMGWLEGLVDKISGGLDNFGKFGTSGASNFVQSALTWLSENTGIDDWLSSLGGKAGEYFNSVFTNLSDNVAKSSGDTVLKSINDAAEQARVMIDENNTNNPPVIRPVLDLTEVQKGLKTLNSGGQVAYAVSVDSGYTSNRDAKAAIQNGSAVPVATGVTKQVNFYQTNNSPKSLNPSEVYRNTKNLLSSYRDLEYVEAK